MLSNKSPGETLILFLSFPSFPFLNFFLVRSNSKKKLTIKFNSVKSLPEDFESRTWAKLQAAIQAIHRKEAVVTSREELFRDVQVQIPPQFFLTQD
jgi:hypothetical protein